jgi:hypothetical protein
VREYFSSFKIQINIVGIIAQFNSDWWITMDVPLAAMTNSGKL